MNEILHIEIIALFVNTPSTTAIRKINSDNSLAWMTAVTFQPMYKTLSIDSTEQNIYFAQYSNPILVVQLLSTTGAIVSSRTQ